MADFTLVDPKGWDYDLHSVYSAYIGYFQIYNIPWYERSWGHLFQSFDEFLAFSWPCITVTDAWTGRAHIVTRLNSIGAFLKMIKTRFGETLPQAPNILQVTPFETTNRHLRHISDYASYKKMHSTLPAAVLSALKARVKAGEPKAIREVWEAKEKTFLTLDFVLNERNEKSVLEWGYAAVRCGHLEALGHWPPNPDTNYRKGHYITAEYADKIINKYTPNFPWQYAFGDSQVASKTKVAQVVQAIISSLLTPDSETSANHLVLVSHNLPAILTRLDDMKIKLPHNVLMIDITAFERSLYAAGDRGAMVDPKYNDASVNTQAKQRVPGSTLSFENLLFSFTISLTPSSSPAGSRSNSNPNVNINLPGVIEGASSGAGPSSQKFPSLPNQPDTRRQTPIKLPDCTLNNAGNASYMCLFALQKLLEPARSIVPSIMKRSSKSHTNGHGHGMANGMGRHGVMSMIGMPVGMPMAMGVPMYMAMPRSAPGATGTMNGMPTINVNGTGINGSGFPGGGGGLRGEGGQPSHSASFGTSTGKALLSSQNGLLGGTGTDSGSGTGSRSGSGSGSGSGASGSSQKKTMENSFGSKPPLPARSSSAYDLAAEFGQMRMGVGMDGRSGSRRVDSVSGSGSGHTKTATGGTESAATASISSRHSRYLTAPGRSGDRASKRFNSFPGLASVGG